MNIVVILTWMIATLMAIPVGENEQLNLTMAGASKLLGGSIVQNSNALPWIALISLHDGSDIYRYSGVLLNEGTLLTVASIAFPRNGAYSLQIQARRTSMFIGAPGATQFHAISRTNHPKYDRLTKEFDISLWTVERTQSTFAIGSFPSLSQYPIFLFHDMLMTTAGYGLIGKERWNTKGSLKELAMPVSKAIECRSVYQISKHTESLFCMGSLDHVRSGGLAGEPVFYMHEGKPTLVGLRSYTATYSRGISLFVSVEASIPFLESRMSRI